MTKRIIGYVNPTPRHPLTAYEVTLENGQLFAKALRRTAAGQFRRERTESSGVCNCHARIDEDGIVTRGNFGEVIGCTIAVEIGKLEPALSF